MIIYKVTLRKWRENYNDEYSNMSLLWDFNEETEKVEEWIASLPHKSKVKVEYTFNNKSLSFIWIKAFDDIYLEEYTAYDLLMANFNQYSSDELIELDVKELEELIANSPDNSEWILTFSLM